MVRKVYILAILFLCILLLASCRQKKIDTKEKLEIDYTVVTGRDIPEELKNIIDQKKEREFRITFASNGYLYVIMGYGMRATSGYSVVLDELYETENTINIKTTLVGPSQADAVNQIVTYPYIVVKMEYRDKPTVFE